MVSRALRREANCLSEHVRAGPEKERAKGRKAEGGRRLTPQPDSGLRRAPNPQPNPPDRLPTRPRGGPNAAACHRARETYERRRKIRIADASTFGERE